MLEFQNSLRSLSLKTLFDSCDEPKMNEQIQKLEQEPEKIPEYLESLIAGDEWIKEHKPFIKHMIKKLESMASEGTMSQETARKVHEIFLKNGLAKHMEHIKCSFKSEKPLELNKLLFHTASPFSKKPSFNNLLKYSNRSIPCHNMCRSQLEILDHWMKTGELDKEKLHNEDVAGSVTSLLGFAIHYQIDDFENALWSWAKETCTDRPYLLFDIAFGLQFEKYINLITTSLGEILQGFDVVVCDPKTVEMKYSCKNSLSHLNKEHLLGTMEALAKHDINISFSIEGNLENQEVALTLEQCSSIIGKNILSFSVSFEKSQSDEMDKVTENVLALLCNMQPLETFSVKGGGTDKLSSAHITKLTKICPTLRSFIIENCPNADKSHIISIAEKSGEKLEHIRFHQCGEFDDEALDTIGVQCPNFKALWLDFGDTDHDVSLEALLRLFTNASHLTAVRFYNSEHAPSGDGDLYELGTFNELQKAFPHRGITLNYNY